MNPFVLANEEFTLPVVAERVLADLDALIRDGFDLDGRHYHVFGGRIGSRFSLSLGMPILGGGAAVVRGNVLGEAGSTTVSLVAGARIEVIVLGSFWALITVVGGVYQIYLQTRRVLGGQASWSAVTEVLPGIALMAGIFALGLILWRKRSRAAAGALIDVVRQYLAETEADESASDASFTIPKPNH